LFEAGVEDAVGNEVGDLVRMAFADGLGGEDEAVGNKKGARLAGRGQGGKPIYQRIGMD